MNFPKRIHIIGSVGSGKTTLARKLSEVMGIPYYEMDNVVWIRNQHGDVRRTEQEKEVLIEQITRSSWWVTEGVHTDEWVQPAFQRADLIVFLDIPYMLRVYRIIKRFIKQKMRLEKAHYHPNLQMFFNMLKWNRWFEQVGKTRFFQMNQLAEEKIVILKSQQALEEWLEYRGIKKDSA